MENILFYLKIVAMILMVIATITGVLSVRKKWKRSNTVDRIRLDSKTEKSKNGGGRLDELAGKLASKVFWNFAIPIVGLGLLAVYWYYQTTTKIYPGDIGKWIWDYWLQILIVYSIGAGLIWLNTEEKTAKTLQKALAGVVFMTLIGFPMWSWSTKPSDIAQQTNSRHSVIPMTSDSKEFWYRLALPESKISERIAIDPGKTVAFHGKEFRIHCVYRDGHEISFLPGETPCPKGDMPWAYVTNEAKGENIILYAFALI